MIMQFCMELFYKNKGTHSNLGRERDDSQQHINDYSSCCEVPLLFAMLDLQKACYCILFRLNGPPISHSLVTKCSGDRAKNGRRLTNWAPSNLGSLKNIVFL